MSMEAENALKTLRKIFESITKNEYESISQNYNSWNEYLTEKFCISERMVAACGIELPPLNELLKKKSEEDERRDQLRSYIKKYLLKKREYIVSDISDDELDKIEKLTWKGKTLNDAINEVLQ